jgi:hypothetical protein
VGELHVTLRGGQYNDCRTPTDFFHAAEILTGGFAVDAAAFADTCLVRYSEPGFLTREPRYFGPDHEFEERRDALNPEVPWCEKGERAWQNPPYGSHLSKFVRAANHQARVYAVEPWLLVPARTDTDWFREAMTLARNVYFVHGRLMFRKRDGSFYLDKNGKPTCAGFPSALIEIHRFGGHPRVTWSWRWEKLLQAA